MGGGDGRGDEILSMPPQKDHNGCYPADIYFRSQISKSYEVITPFDLDIYASSHFCVCRSVVSSHRYASPRNSVFFRYTHRVHYDTMVVIIMHDSRGA